jgi:geranylgeranyl diphosphate synthase type II
MMAFAEYSRARRGQIDQALQRYTDGEDGCPPQLQDAIRHSLLGGGKRLRPLLTLMAAETCGCDPQRALPAACAVEMIHTYSLIHDDLPAMDDDDTRRGQPSCHAKYGEAMAILAGDALLTRAFEVLARDLQPPAVAAACCAALGQAAGWTGMVGGQVDDIQAAHQAGNLDQLESIHRRKTGALIRAALRLGGLVAQASDEQLQALDTYGMHLGLAFQIVDDLLDLRGDEAAVGKRLGKDREQGKLTFPSCLGPEESVLRATQLIDLAQQSLALFGARADALVSLARFVLERSR